MSGGTVKLANTRFTSVKNDYSLVFDIQAEIKKVEDDESIQTMSFNFRNIDDIMKMQGRSTVDFIGILHYIG